MISKCIYPENVLVIGNDGVAINCPLEANSVSFGNINNGIIPIWNSKERLTFREQLDKNLNETGKPCWQCGQLERRGDQSLRTQGRLLNDTGQLAGIQFKLSNRCQLACAHCSPKLSSTWGKILGHSNYVKTFKIENSVLDELKTLLPSLKFLKFTGGEPWMDPTHWRILEELKTLDRSNCELRYITNGLATFRPELWDGWKRVEVTVSLDGVEEAFEWFRRPASWQKLLKNIETFRKLGVSVRFNYSITPWTINFFNKATEMFSENIFPVPIMHPAHCSLSSISREDYARLGFTTSYPNLGIIGNRPLPLANLKSWALNWDKRWNTVGLAEQVHPWLKMI